MFLLSISLCTPNSQPVQPWYFYGKKFGYIVAFKPHDAYDWWYETISDPETRRYVHRDSYFIPTEEDFQVREFQVKITSFNLKGEGPYGLTTVIFYPRDGENFFFWFQSWMLKFPWEMKGCDTKPRAADQLFSFSLPFF